MIQHRAPLTQSQRLFWRGTQLDPSDASYTMVWRFDIYMALEEARFGAALNAVVNGADSVPTPCERFSIPAGRRRNCPCTSERTIFRDFRSNLPITYLQAPAMVQQKEVKAGERRQSMFRAGSS